MAGSGEVAAVRGVRWRHESRPQGMLAEVAALARIEEMGGRMALTGIAAELTESTRPPSGRCGRSATTTGSRRRRSGSSGRCSSAACGIAAGQRVLDVAAGTGNVAIRAAEAGAQVVASDLTPENFEAGRREARARGVELEWVEADAEALPFGDGEFDVVTSSFGAMFAPDHQAVADELLRVCRPGGTIGMLNFTPEGLGGEFFELFGATRPRRRRARSHRSCGGARSTCASSSATGWTRSR